MQECDMLRATILLVAMYVSVTNMTSKCSKFSFLNNQKCNKTDKEWYWVQYMNNWHVASGLGADIALRYASCYISSSTGSHMPIIHVLHFVPFYIYYICNLTATFILDLLILSTLLTPDLLDLLDIWLDETPKNNKVYAGASCLTQMWKQLHRSFVTVER